MNKLGRTVFGLNSSGILYFIAIVSLFWLVFVIIPSFPKVRKILSAPLIAHDAAAKGDVCYVLAGGGSLWERLDAGADLIQMGRVASLMIMQDNVKGSFSFKANKSWTRTQWITDYLAWRGISSDRIRWIDQTSGLFGTLTEARSVAKNLPANVNNLVVVSSPPHMRRSVLAFTRSLPDNVHVVPYEATEFGNSHEMHHPIWLEYLKLLLYYAIV